MVAEPITDAESTAVNDYADWYFNDNLTKVGQWAGNFSSISSTEADGQNMYCLLDDGTWVPFTSADNPDATLNAFRGFFLSDAPINAPAASPALAPITTGPKQYRTLFNNAGAGTVSDGNVPDAFNILYNPDIPTPSPDVSGVEPIIQTIEADGTHRYFDLQGRQLPGEPDKGIYIDNGKKKIK